MNILGTKVCVTGPGSDECFDDNDIGREGVIVAVLCDDYGASPSDPYVIVRFAEEQEDMFWPSELTIIDDKGGLPTIKDVLRERAAYINSLWQHVIACCTGAIKFDLGVLGPVPSRQTEDPCQLLDC